MSEHPFSWLSESVPVLLNQQLIQKGSPETATGYEATAAGQLLLDAFIRQNLCPDHPDPNADLKRLPGGGKLAVQIGDLTLLAAIILGKPTTDLVVKSAGDLRLDDFSNSTLMLLASCACHGLRHSEPDARRRVAWTWEAGLSAPGKAVFDRLLSGLLQSAGEKGEKVKRIVDAVIRSQPLPAAPKSS